MAERTPSNDQAAFGVFPQLQRNRSKQDREAAKNVPIDLARGAVAGVLGAPGDIESLVRMLPYLDEKTVLPTSEDIEKRLPLRSETPVSKAATGLGILGGGFYTGPASPLRVVGALPSAIKHGAEEFAKASVAGAPHIMKPTGKANWLGGTNVHVPEGDMWRFKTQPIAGESPAQRIPHHEELLKDPTLNQDQIDRVLYQLEQTKGEAALDKWADSALLGYFKGQLATPDDPVRLFIEKNYANIESKFAKDQERAAKMAQRAEAETDPRKKANIKRQADAMMVQAKDDREIAMQNISHLPPDMLKDIVLDPKSYIKEERVKAGFPAEGVATTDPARKWEHQADEAIKVTRAGDIQSAMELQPKLDKALQDQYGVYQKVNEAFGNLLRDRGLDEDSIDALVKSMPRSDKADSVGMLGDLLDADSKYLKLLDQDRSFPKFAAKDNPFVAKLDPETKMYSGYMGDLGFEHVMDVLRQDLAAERLRPEQLNKLSVEQAVKRTQEYNLDMARKMNAERASARANLPVHKEYPEGYKWVQLNQPGNFAAESQAMGHSVKGYEPSTRHPDWVSGSGDEGSDAYGLGGWEAIKSGRAKVYSLVDSRGAPHTTIEVASGAHPIGYSFKGASRELPDTFEYNRNFEEQYPRPTEEQKQAILSRAQDLFKNTSNIERMDAFQMAANEVLGPLPAEIRQIKGKGNAKPIADYIPYVQDFVKGGKWTDVRDFHNTDLVKIDADSDLAQKIKASGKEPAPYVSQNELTQLLKEYGNPPAEGMKRGGKVSISKNPDTMMMAVNNQKMKNGVPAYAGGKAVLKKGIEAIKSEVPRLAMQFGNDLPLNMNIAEVENLAKRFPEPVVDRVNMAHKDVLKRTPELQEAAARIEAGDMSADEYARLVQRHKPVTPYETVPAPATREEILAALSKTSREAEGLPRKETYFGKPSSTLKEGDPVGLRLDIPSYNQANTWVVTAHGPRKSPVSGGAGTRIGYEPVAMATDVDFSVSPKAALGIAKGAEKNTIATMEGKWKPTNSDEAFTLAKQYLKSPEWRQVGMDPERHSFFYDRETMAPVVNAEEVIQIGPLVLAKNPKYGDPKDFKYSSGGLAHMAEGGSEDDAKPFFGGAGTKKYAAAKKRAEQADVNTLKDPKTYAAVAGLMGEAPDEMGFSVLHPDYQGIKDVADPAFYAGTALGVAPLMKVFKAPAMALGRAGEKYAEKVVPQIMEQGGMGADILGGLAQGTRSNVYLPHTPKKPDPTVGTRYKRTDIGGLVPRQDLNIEKLDKSSVKIFPWDASDRNKLVTEVSDIPLTKPVLLEGGDNYMRDLQHVQNRIAGASNEGIANRIQDRIDNAAVENQILGGTGKVYGFPIRMGEKAEHAATFPTDIAMDLLKQGNLSKKELDELTNELRGMAFEAKGKGYFQNIAPVDSPEFLTQLREGIKGNKEKGISSVTDMNLRKGLMDRLSQVKYQKRLEYNYPDLVGSVIADELKGIPKGYVGNVSAELDPFSKIRPSKSSTYSHDFGGQYFASMPDMPVEFLMPNTYEGIYLEMKALYPKAKPEALRNMTIGAMEKRKDKISEMIGPRSIDAVKSYQEGLKKGEFDPNNIKEVYDYMRRQKLKLKFAEGGAVTGDDLIIEERPL